MGQAVIRGVTGRITGSGLPPTSLMQSSRIRGGDPRAPWVRSKGPVARFLPRQLGVNGVSA